MNTPNMIRKSGKQRVRYTAKSNPWRRKEYQEYDPKFCQTILEVATSGQWVPAMALALGCVPKTIYNWAEKHPEFKEAFEKARVISQGSMEKFGLMGMAGELPKFNYKVWKDIMINRFPGEYTFSEDSKKGDTNITLNTLQVLPDDKLNSKIESLTKMINQAEYAQGKLTKHERIEDGTFTVVGGESEKDQVSSD